MKPSAAQLSREALQMYFSSHDGLAGESETLRRKASKASKALAVLMWLHITAAFFAVLFAYADSQKPDASYLPAALAVGEMLLFWILWSWSRHAPLAPAIAGLLLYVTMWWSRWIIMLGVVHVAFPKTEVARWVAHFLLTPSPMTLVRWFTVITLVTAIIASVRQRRMADKVLATSESEAIDAYGRQKLSEVTPAAEPARPEDGTRIAGVTTAILLYFALLGTLLFITLLQFLPEYEPGDTVRITFIISVLVIVWGICSWRDTLRPLATPISPWWYIGAAGGGMVTFLLASVFLEAVTIIFQLETAAPETMPHLFAAVLLIAVQPAIIEELAFRGVIYGALARVLRHKEVIVVTSIAFMAMHMDPMRFPHTLLLGLVTGWLRCRTGSWLPGVFLHFVHNFMVIIML